MTSLPSFMLSPMDLEAAVTFLRHGDLVAFPTETVYGLGADATSPEAVAKIYAAKGRPHFNPLIAHVRSLACALAEAVFTHDAMALAEAFWPGPLTLILPRQPHGTVCDLACGGLSTLGLRIPNDPIAGLLMAAFGRPIAAPSANRSGGVSPTTARHVQADLGDSVALVLDGGSCAIGIESTIIACLDGGVRMLRPGGLDLDAIETVLGRSLDARTDSTLIAPGMLVSHYAPRARLRLDALELAEGELGLDFGGVLPGATFDLSPQADPRQAAASLYRCLRDLDSRSPEGIAVAPISTATSLGAAIRDRLERAAAPRATLP